MMRLWHNALRLHAAAMRSSCSSVILWPWVSFSQGMSDESRKFGASDLKDGIWLKQLRHSILIESEG